MKTILVVTVGSLVKVVVVTPVNMVLINLEHVPLSSYFCPGLHTTSGLYADTLTVSPASVPILRNISWKETFFFPNLNKLLTHGCDDTTNRSISLRFARISKHTIVQD